MNAVTFEMEGVSFHSSLYHCLAKTKMLSALENLCLGTIDRTPAILTLEAALT